MSLLSVILFITYSFVIILFPVSFFYVFFKKVKKPILALVTGVVSAVGFLFSALALGIFSYFYLEDPLSYEDIFGPIELSVVVGAIAVICLINLGLSYKLRKLPTIAPVISEPSGSIRLQIARRLTAVAIWISTIVLIIILYVTHVSRMRDPEFAEIMVLS